MALYPPAHAGGPAGPRHGGAMADWCLNIRASRLLAWASLLWLFNLVVLGPIAVGAATLGGAQHRMDPDNIPWLAAVIWAPLVEELLFRYGLRRPLQALWVIPVVLPALIWGPKFWTGCLVAAVILLAISGTRHMGRFKRGPRRFYQRHFGLVFHLAALTFAAVHLGNFSFGSTAWWLLPLLVLPQWLTGLVLGWMRVRRGIAASMALHAVFNAGPMVMIWLLLKLVPDMAL
ncbi:CAAX protease self-immunity family protein [Bordetella holmesii 41130]|nr:CAAX protease self-immunity family protein [Bordetella holmesii 41130]